MSETPKDSVDSQLMEMFKISQYCNEKRLDIIEKQLTQTDRGIETTTKMCQSIMNELVTIEKGLISVAETQAMILAKMDQLENKVNQNRNRNRHRNKSRNRNKNKYKNYQKNYQEYMDEPIIMDIQYDGSEQNANAFESLLGSLLFPNQKKEVTKEKKKVKKKKKDEKNRWKYDKSGKFEKLNIDADNLNDIIRLGDLYPKLKNEEERNKKKGKRNKKNKEDEYIPTCLLNSENEDDECFKCTECNECMCGEADEEVLEELSNTSDESDHDGEVEQDKSEGEEIDQDKKIEEVDEQEVTEEVDEQKVKEDGKVDISEPIDSVAQHKFYKMNGKNYSINLKTMYKLAKPLSKLSKMIGLKKVKKSVIDMILYYIQNFEKDSNQLLHTVIEGPPGVGKTEFGKILAEIYAALGVIESDKFKVVKRTDLVGEYLGHTAAKTQKVIDEADGGVLFIDEAYSLGNEEKRDSYSKECIDTLNQNLTENRNKFICIIAGYPNELDRCFFSYNPGLKRRFPFRFAIDGYNSSELKDIFLKMVHDANWMTHHKVNSKFLEEFFTKNKKSFQFFGGDMENLLTSCKFCHSHRVIGKHPKLRRILTKEDIKNGLKRFTDNKKSNNELKPPPFMYT